MKLNFLFFLGAKSQSKQKITPVDKSWMNPDAFKLPAEISFRTDRAFDMAIQYGPYSMLHEPCK